MSPPETVPLFRVPERPERFYCSHVAIPPWATAQAERGEYIQGLPVTSRSNLVDVS